MADRMFWKDKKVFLTGHTGFKGTWLSLMLEELGAVVYGYALKPDSRFFPAANPKIEKSWEAYITDREKLAEAVFECAPEIVIHFASHSTLNKSYEITDYIFDTNVMGLVNLLESVRRNPGIKAVLIVTSDKCYRNLESPDPYEEDSPLGAQDPYSASKACQELVAECYRNSFFWPNQLNIPIATARASNVLGGGDYNLDRLLPSLINSYLNGKDAVIRRPEAVRPWQNVLDVLGGYLCLIEHMVKERHADSVYCGPYNFGPKQDGFITVGHMAEKLAAYFEDANFRIEKNGQVAETNTLKISSKKSQRELKWEPKFSMDDTLGMAAEFAIREKGGEDVRNICMEYIADYLKDEEK